MSIADIYMIICYFGIMLCAISLAITLFVFFRFNIIGVIGDLSGFTARKGIESIRNQNSITGNKAYKPSHVNRERGKLTDRITPSGKLISAIESVEVSVGTEKFNTGKLAANEDTILFNAQSAMAVSWLDDKETTILYDKSETHDMKEFDETTVLGIGQDETAILYVESNVDDTESKIMIEDEIIFVHSKEQIE